MPQDVPKVTWTVAETVETTVGGQPVVARRLVGHADNSAHPAISVDIRMAVVVPVNARGPVPVLTMFGWGNMPGEAPPRLPGAEEPAAPPSTDQLVAAGWGYVSLSTASIQADNGAGLTSGIIGLTNAGKRRTPEQWGSLRAWAWGAARALDYLETLPAVDAKRVGIEGVSRYGKAALVTMAFEPRFALVLVGSSGEGGAKPHRRNLGEQVENLTGSGAYHWMAGNFLKYGAAEASFGSNDADDVNARLADADGTLSEGMMVDGLHPSLKGYQVWAEGLIPILAELLGPPAATDHAPPPTGDPSAAERSSR